MEIGLNKKISISNSVMNFKCSLCPNLFSKAEDVENHLSEKHDVKKNFLSYYCSTVVAKKSKAQSITKEVYSTLKQKGNGTLQLKCSLCSLEYNSYEGMRIHVACSHKWAEQFWKNYCSVISKPVPKFIPPVKTNVVLSDLGDSSSPPDNSNSLVVPVGTVDFPSKQHCSRNAEITNGHNSAEVSTTSSVDSSAVLSTSNKPAGRKPNLGKKDKKGKKTGFSKGISNLFAQGLIPTKKKGKEDPKITSSVSELPAGSNIFSSSGGSEVSLAETKCSASSSDPSFSSNSST